MLVDVQYENGRRRGKRRRQRDQNQVHELFTNVLLVFTFLYNFIYDCGTCHYDKCVPLVSGQDVVVQGI